MNKYYSNINVIYETKSRKQYRILYFDFNNAFKKLVDDINNHPDTDNLNELYEFINVKSFDISKTLSSMNRLEKNNMIIIKYKNVNMNNINEQSFGERIQDLMHLINAWNGNAIDIIQNSLKSLQFIGYNELQVRSKDKNRDNNFFFQFIAADNHNNIVMIMFKLNTYVKEEKTNYTHAIFEFSLTDK